MQVDGLGQPDEGGGGRARDVAIAAGFQVIVGGAAGDAVHQRRRRVEAPGEFLRRAIAEHRQLPRQRQRHVRIGNSAAHDVSLQGTPGAGEWMRPMGAADRDQMIESLAMTCGEVQPDHRAVGRADEGRDARDA